MSRRKDKSPAGSRRPSHGSRSVSVDDTHLQSNAPPKTASKSRFGFGRLTTSEVEEVPLNDVEEGGGKEAPPAADGDSASGTPDATMSPIKMGDAKDPSKLLNKVTKQPRFSLGLLATRAAFAHPYTTDAAQAPPNDVPTLSPRSPSSESPSKH